MIMGNWNSTIGRLRGRAALLGLALLFAYWPLIAAVFAPFALGWIALAYVMDSRGRTLITGQ